MKVRVEMHLTENEADQIDKIARQQNRSRKNFCETEMRKIIGVFLELAGNHLPVIKKPLQGFAY